MMAFGFLGDIVEEIGEVILPRGTRGETIGGLVGLPQTGKVLSQAVSAATGKSATTTPTVAQSPQYAPETAVSSTQPGVYRPSFAAYERAGVPLYASTGYPSTVTKPGAIGMAETVLDVAYSMGQQFFGGDQMVCGSQPKRLFSVKDRNGVACLSVTRKQQHQLKQMVMYMGIEQTASYLGLSVPELAGLLVKKFPPRRKGISAAQLRNAKRVNRTIMGMAKQLTDSCKTTTRRR